MDPIQRILDVLAEIGIPQTERSEILNLVAKRAQSVKRLQFNFGEESRQGKPPAPPLPVPGQVGFAELQAAKGAEGPARFPFLQQIRNMSKQAAIKRVELAPVKPSNVGNQ